MTHISKESERTVNGLNDERGVALLLCLLIMAILTVVVLEFHYEIQVDAALTANSFLSLEAEYVARSGVALCLAMLRADAENDREGGRRIDHLAEAWVGGLRPTQVGRGLVAARISDEDGKLNVNRVIGAEQRNKPDPQVVNQLKQLFTELQILAEADPVELTEPICDWIDPDSVPRSRASAEDEYYRSLPIPYACKNTWFDSIEELALVKGFTRDLVCGQYRSPLTPQDQDNLSERSLFESEAPPGLAEFLTISGRPDGKINVNTAPETVIRAVLYQSRLVADSIISARQNAPFESMADLKRNLPPGPAARGIGNYVVLGSDHFSIVSEGSVHGMRTRIETVVQRRAGAQRVTFDTLSWKVTR